MVDAPFHSGLVDARGRVWVGYFDRGLDVVEGGGRTVHIEDEHLFCINRIVHDPGRGLTAVATANGLVMLDDGLRVRQVQHQLGKYPDRNQKNRTATVRRKISIWTKEIARLRQETELWA